MAFPTRDYRFSRFRMTDFRPRHWATVFLFFYILLSCIVVGGSISPPTKGVYLAKLTYKATDNADYFYSGSITQLDARIGYFSTCLRTHTNTTKGSWQCSRNETQILLNDHHFNLTSPPDKDLYNFFHSTAYMFRHDCMSPYILVVSIVLSFITICFYAWYVPWSNANFFRVSFSLSAIAFSLALVAAVWQETNTVTGTKLMKVMVDDYYSLSTHYGTGVRALIWISVVLSFCAATSLLVLMFASIAVSRTEAEEQFGAPGYGLDPRLSGVDPRYSGAGGMMPDYYGEKL